MKLKIAAFILLLTACAKETTKELGNIYSLTSNVPIHNIVINGSIKKIARSYKKSYPGILHVVIETGGLAVKINIDTPNNTIKLKWNTQPMADAPFLESDDYIVFSGINQESIRYIGASLYIYSKFQYKDIIEINATVK